MLIKNIFLGFIGFSSGIIIAGAFIALISMIGLIPRLISKTKTAKKIMLYENILTLGATYGNLVTIYKFPMPLGVFSLFLHGSFSGIFVGMLAGAIAETLNVIPIFSRRAKLRKGLPYILLSIGIGKTVGSLVQFYLLK